MELDSDDDKQIAPPLLNRNDMNSDDGSNKDSDEDSDETNICLVYHHWLMSTPGPCDGVRWSAPIELDSNDNEKNGAPSVQMIW